MGELFNKAGESASFYDVISWWLLAYPKDVFVEQSKAVVEISRLMQLIKDKMDRGR